MPRTAPYRELGQPHRTAYAPPRSEALDDDRRRGDHEQRHQENRADGEPDETDRFDDVDREPRNRERGQPADRRSQRVSRPGSAIGVPRAHEIGDGTGHERQHDPVEHEQHDGRRGDVRERRRRGGCRVQHARDPAVPQRVALQPGRQQLERDDDGCRDPEDRPRRRLDHADGAVEHIGRGERPERHRTRHDRFPYPPCPARDPAAERQVSGRRPRLPCRAPTTG